MQVTLATVQRKVIDSSCLSVVLPTTTGQIEILPGHTALLTELNQGELRIKLDGSLQSYKIRGGFAHMVNDQLSIITESAAALL